MLTQLVCIGDSHFCRNARQPERLKALDAIIAAGLALPKLGAWLWPGDLFHGLHTTHVRDRNELADRLITMANAAPVIGCRGNHDPAEELQIFERLQTKWPITLDEAPRVRSVELATGKVATVFVLPWPDRAGLVGEGVAHGDVGAAARLALDALFMDAAAQLEAAAGRGEIPAFITHASITGAVASNGQPQVGAGIEVDASMLSRLGSILKIANHIHAGQEIAGAIYPGSICSLDWGEVHPHRYLVVDYASPSVFAVRSVVLDVAGLWLVEGELSREGFVWHVEKGPTGEPVDPPASWRGQEVRVRARYKQSEKGVLDMAKAGLLANFAEANKFELELVAVPDRSLRAPAVAAAVTTVDKVVAWAEVAGVVLPDVLRERLQGFEVAEPEQLFARVRAEMDALCDPSVPVAVAQESEAAVA